VIDQIESFRKAAVAVRLRPGAYVAAGERRASDGLVTVVHLYQVHRTDTTALIVCNDTWARHVFRSLRALGIGVPNRISLLSFDNAYRYSAFPVTTVDFGMAELGYSSFHALVGDIPVVSGKSKCITAKPYVVENGSVVCRSDAGSG
jgi:DNA-binding LacI/PurR family transcriptional regulator